MPYIPNVNPNELITSAWGNTIRDHVVQRFATAAARAAAIPAPVEGQVTWLADYNEIQVYDGATWKQVHGGIVLGAGQVPIIGTYSGQAVQMRGWSQVMGLAGDGTFASAFPAPVNGVLSATVTYIGPYAVNLNLTTVTVNSIGGIALTTTTGAPVAGSIHIAFLAMVW